MLHGSLLSLQLSQLAQRDPDACGFISQKNGKRCGHPSWAHRDDTVGRGCKLPGAACMCHCLTLPANVKRLPFDSERYEDLRKKLMGS